MGKWTIIRLYLWQVPDHGGGKPEGRGPGIGGGGLLLRIPAGGGRQGARDPPLLPRGPPRPAPGNYVVVDRQLC